MSCFINHKDEIKGYIDKLAAEKQQVYEQAEKNRELIECGCCYQMVLFEECGACNEGDLFCKTCIQKNCHKESHIPLRCEELENDEQAKARKYIEDKMTKALVRCPLYSSEKVLHVDAVNAVAVKALQTVTTTNPELKLKQDPTKVLPSASTASTNVPPGVDENVDRLLARLQAMNNELDLPNEEHQLGELINLENGHYANEENGPDGLIRQILEDNRPDAEMHQVIEQMNPGPFNQNFLVGLRNFHEMGHDRH